MFQMLSSPITFLIMDHFGYHLHTLCNIVYLANAQRFFSRIVHSIAARGFFVVVMFNINNGGEKNAAVRF